MRHRGWMSAEERQKRSRLAKMVHEGGLLRANLVQMARRCGKRGCRCEEKGNEHVSLYVAQSYKGKSRMLYVPKEWERRVEGWVKNHHEVRRLLEQVSQLYWERLRQRRG